MHRSDKTFKHEHSKLTISETVYKILAGGGDHVALFEHKDSLYLLYTNDRGNYAGVENITTGAERSCFDPARRIATYFWEWTDRQQIDAIMGTQPF